MLTRYACTAAELSCVIGNIFAELSPPCAACGAEVLQITGTTVTGNAATLTVTEAGFDFDGCADDTAMIERMRKGKAGYQILRALYGRLLFDPSRQSIFAGVPEAD